LSDIGRRQLPRRYFRRLDHVARRRRGRVATVALNSFEFKQPVFVSDVASFLAEITKEVYAQRNPGREIKVNVTEASLTYVAVGPDRKSRELPPS
jgi:acyl-CoA thioesterase YciA